jgi:signal transduction histidine kinase
MDKPAAPRHKVRIAAGACAAGAMADEGQDTNNPPSPNVRAIYSAKALILALALLAVWLLRLLASPAMPAGALSLVILFLLVPTVAIVAWPARPPTWLLPVGPAVDVAGITATISVGGEAARVAGPILYAVAIAAAGLLVSQRAAYVTAAGSAATYGILVWAWNSRLVPRPTPHAWSLDQDIASVVMAALVLLLAAWAVSYAAGQIRASYQHAERLQAEAASALSHDLKNPLAIIHGYADMIEDATAEERVEYAHRIQRSVQQALDLVRNVLDVAAIDARPILPHPIPLSLNELVAQSVDAYRPAALAKGIRLVPSYAVGLPRLEADPQLLTRAIGNLVSNAIKYTPENGTVEVITTVSDASLSVTVHDSGGGIPAAERAHLFQKHPRAAVGRREGGPGLGLYIVRRIVEAHRGSVSVTSEPGKGSSFVLALPAGR